MKVLLRYSRTLLVLVLAGIILASSASAVATPKETPAPGSAAGSQVISATASVSSAPAGTPVTISGAVSGGNPVDRVMIWIFAGSYLDVSMAPVNPDGTYAKTYPTEGLPAATYYVFVQSPGNDGEFGLVFDASGKYAGQVVDAGSGTLLINFTGTGSVQDNAAAVALTDALNRRDSDDVYTRTTFQLTAPAPVNGMPVQSGSQAATTAQAPLSLPTVLLSLGAVAAFVPVMRRK